MAHYRRTVGAAAALNTTIFVIEGIVGLREHSLSLVMDSVHNLSDEIALIFLYLAFVFPLRRSSALQGWANVLNSLGLVAVCALIVWQAVDRLFHPVPILGVVPVAVGLVAAAGNWGVARLLLEPARLNPAIRLAYLHNMGDVFVSLAPVAAGLLISLTGRSFFDPLAALGVAWWIIGSTSWEMIQSRDQLLSPAQLVCGHGPDEPVTPS